METARLWGNVYDIGDIPLDDLVALWADGTTSELWEGRLVQEDMTYPPHAFTANEIGWLLRNYLSQQGVMANVAQHMLFNLTQPGQKRTVLAPDVAIVPTGTTLLPRMVPLLAPWLAVEIISPQQTMSQIRLKINRYLQAGTAEAWIVDAEQIMIEIITAQSTAIYYDQQTIISTILPGFTPTVRSLIP